MTLNRSPPLGTSETIPRPSGHQRFPGPTASPEASHVPHASHPLHQACSCSRCSWKCCLQHDSPPHPRHTRLGGQTDQRGRTHRKKRRALVLRRLLLRGMKKVLYAARTPTQLGLQPATAWFALVPPGLLANTVTGGRGSIPQSSGTSPALPGVGTDGISLRMGCSGGRGSFWGRRKTERWTWLVLPGVEGEGTVPYPGPPTNESAQPLTEGLIPATPCGHEEIRPIDDGLAEKHQLSRHQLWWCKGSWGCSTAPTPPLCRSG